MLKFRVFSLLASAIIALLFSIYFLRWIPERLNLRNETIVATKNSYSFDPDSHQTPWPRIAWLMSYPNSGTSYTLDLVLRASNRTVATNYGEGCDLVNGKIQPLYTHSPTGPYLLHPSKGMPEKYILTKTHCGSRCGECGPSNYIETMESFMDMCGAGSIKQTTKAGNVIVQINNGKYDPKLAKRAIHLVRNPFNNIVSNYHLKVNKKEKRKHPNDKNGFKEYCRHLDEKFKREEQLSRFLPASILDLFQGVPCHSSFFMYAQWHNLAVQVQNFLQLPTLVVWYEDYESDFDKTSRQIFDFLGVDPLRGVPQFIQGKSYLDYFSVTERNATLALLRRITDHSVLPLLERYL